MSLDLPKLMPQLDVVGETAAERTSRHAELTPRARDALHQAADLAPEAISAKIKLAGDRWAGALPTEEAVDSVLPAAPHLDRLAVVGADGSQIYPDRHGAFLYYLINIGSIRIDHGSNETPETTSRPSLYFQDEDLFSASGAILSSELVNAKRDVAEMAELARVCDHHKNSNQLALLDNGLLLWLMLQVNDQIKKEANALLEEYLKELARIRQSGAAIAGITDRPRNANVLSLIHLAGLDEGVINDDTLQATPYRLLLDSELFDEVLPVGHRSALFVHGTTLNEDFRKEGHEVQFFYLKATNKGPVLRVEIPQWVAEKPAMLDWVHSGILEQCRTTGGFPYALVRAHELAVVKNSERSSFERLLSQRLIAEGISPTTSQKSLTKQWLGGQKRHRV